MAGNQAPDIGQLTKILTIAIAATIILVVAVGAIFAFKMLTGDNGSPDPSPSSLGQASEASGGQNAGTTSTSPEYYTNPYNSGTQDEPELTNTTSDDTSEDDSVKTVEPFIPDDPLFSPTEFNNSVPDDTPNLEYYQVLFKNSIPFSYNSSSILVNVGKGPLIVGYKFSNFIVTTNNGNGNPYYSFLDLTVKDNSTGEVIADGGYGRTHPTTVEQYIPILKTGEFRIDMYGTGLDVELIIISGTVPENPNAIAIDPRIKNKYSVIAKKARNTPADNTIKQSGEPEEEWW